MSSLQSVHGDAFGGDGIVRLGEVDVATYGYQRRVVVGQGLEEEIENGGREVDSIGEGQAVGGHVGHREGEGTGAGHCVFVNVCLVRVVLFRR